MEVIITVWNFIVSHWGNVIGFLTSTKLVADNIEGVKKLLPQNLETGKETRTYLENTADILNDKSVTIEDKKWEVTMRQELVKSMVHLTAVEAAYHIAGSSVIVAFFAILLYHMRKLLNK
jgi:hypothetical protein